MEKQPRKIQMTYRQTKKKIVTYIRVTSNIGVTFSNLSQAKTI